MSHILREYVNLTRLLIACLVREDYNLKIKCKWQVVNHGVSVELLELLKMSAHEFFEQSPENKAVYLKEVSPSKLVKYGTSFVPEKEKAIEWKDYVSMLYTNDDEALQHWPLQCRYK